MSTPLRVGDIVQIHEIELLGARMSDNWRAARVTTVQPHKFSVTPLKGDFWGYPEKWVLMSEAGRMWK
jgi:hypothetical protein